jgi:hypothetical protein
LFPANPIINQPRQGERVGRINKIMESVQKGIHLLSDEEFILAKNAGMYIVKVCFDNEFDPVFLASSKKLEDSDYIAFLHEIGMSADNNYRIDHYYDNETYESKGNNYEK